MRRTRMDIQARPMSSSRSWPDLLTSSWGQPEPNLRPDPAPLREAGEIKDRIAFFDEHADITVDGRALERPVTPWSRR